VRSGVDWPATIATNALPGAPEVGIVYGVGYGSDHGGGFSMGHIGRRE
jgi:hypothetical protein